jgi:hypothetical protein
MLKYFVSYSRDIDLCIMYRVRENIVLQDSWDGHRELFIIQVPPFCVFERVGGTPMY